MGVCRRLDVAHQVRLSENALSQSKNPRNTEGETPLHPIDGTPSNGRQTQLDRDAELLQDQLRHDLARPQPEIETILPRILAHDPAPHLPALFFVQLWFRAASLAGGQCLLP